MTSYWWPQTITVAAMESNFKQFSATVLANSELTYWSIDTALLAITLEKAFTFCTVSKFDFWLKCSVKTLLACFKFVKPAYTVVILILLFEQRVCNTYKTHHLHILNTSNLCILCTSSAESVFCFPNAWDGKLYVHVALGMKWWLSII